jgi:ribosomal protein L11 methyltransferase
MDSSQVLMTTDIHLTTGLIICESEQEALSIADTLDLYVESCSWMFNREAKNWLVEILYSSDRAIIDLALSTANKELTEVYVLENRNWLEENQKAFPPMQIGNFYIYGSHIASPDPQTLIPLQIDAATAFGSGNHGSTRGCLIALTQLQNTFKPTSIIDVGCGSGILAMGTSYLWPSANLIASDIDAECVEVTRRNCTINNIEKINVIEATGVSHSDIQAHAPYNLIIANILANVLCSLAPELHSISASKGYIVLSGILSEQKNDVIHCYESLGFVLKDSYLFDDWVTLVFQN